MNLSLDIDMELNDKSADAWSGLFRPYKIRFTASKVDDHGHGGLIKINKMFGVDHLGPKRNDECQKR